MMCSLMVGLILFSLFSTTLCAETKHHRIVPMGEEFFRGNDDMCGGMSASVRSGDFFEGLKGRRTKNGTEFRRNSQRIETLPDELMVTVRAITGHCIGPGDPHQRAANLERFDATFIKSLRFEGFWKNGLKIKKAAVGLFSEGEGRVPDYFPADAVPWDYELTVKSAGMPLTNTLVLDVLSADGKLISRFSAAF